MALHTSKESEEFENGSRKVIDVAATNFELFSNAFDWKSSKFCDFKKSFRLVKNLVKGCKKLVWKSSESWL